MAREPVRRPDLGGPFPEHVAIIMDGNGRWAEARGLPRIAGHREGVHSVREIVTECARMGLGSLTLYAFSVENWKRPGGEVGFLMRLLMRYLLRERQTLMDNSVRLRGIGRLDDLGSVVKTLRETEEMTRANDGMLLRLALSYGGRTEIGDAVRAIATKAAAGELDPASIDADTLRDHLYDPETPDPDLLIRTAGEMRLSNFLLWQSSYSELFVAEECWPDFRKPQLLRALKAYAGRTRKFGGLATRSEETSRESS